MRLGCKGTKIKSKTCPKYQSKFLIAAEKYMEIPVEKFLIAADKYMEMPIEKFLIAANLWKCQ